ALLPGLDPAGGEQAPEPPAVLRGPGIGARDPVRAPLPPGPQRPGSRPAAPVDLHRQGDAPRLRGPPGQPYPADVDLERSPLVREMKAGFPESRRARTLVLIPHESPHYAKQLPPAEQAAYRALISDQVRALERAGFAALEVCRDYAVADFNDRCHLSEQGGAKMAVEVAAKVRNLARRLGDVPEGGKP